VKAKLIAFIIAPECCLEDVWLQELVSSFGNLEHKGKFFPFDRTDYYKAEMGENLHRCVVSFEGQIHPENITEYKSKAINIEKNLRNTGGGRLINIDVGYMDSDKVVLPSVKRGPFKLYAGNGFWLDMILTYAKGDFRPTEWAFSDFKENPYKRDLILIREKFKRGR